MEFFIFQYSRKDAGMDKERIKALDGLRAFAIISVLISHSAWKMNSQITVKIGSADIHNIFYNGWFGVDLFFVLSGFLIASQLLKRPLTRTSLRNFMCKRFFRIAPAYYISVFATLMYLHIYPTIGEKPLSNMIEIWGLPLMSHIIFLHDYIGRFPWIDGIFWSIPIEIKFYMILPLLVYFLSHIKNNTHKIAIISVAYIIYLSVRTFYIYTQYGVEDVEYLDYFFQIKTPFHMALDGLTIGVLCAFILQRDFIKGVKSNTKLLDSLFYAGFTLFAILALTPHFINDAATLFERTIMTSLFSLSFGIILLCLIKGCSATPFFSNNILSFIARISYSLYLTHTYALSLQSVTIEKLGNYIASPTTCWLVSMPIFFGCAIITATILYMTVEKPIINWSRNKWSSITQSNV